MTAPNAEYVRAWVERNTGRSLTDDQARCVRVLCALAQPYNLPLIAGGWSDVADYEPCRSPADEPVPLPPVEFGPSWVMARTFAPMSTFDFDNLTRLVVAAHAEAVRVELAAETYLAVDRESFVSQYDSKTQEWVETDEHPSHVAACLTIRMHPRQREGSLFERHPSLADVLTAGGQK